MEMPPPFPADRLLVTTTRLSVKFVVAVSRRIPLPATFVGEISMPDCYVIDADRSSGG